MKDFQRRDFGEALRKLFESDDAKLAARGNADANEFGDFQGKGDALDAGTVDPNKPNQADELGTLLIAFEDEWDSLKEFLGQEVKFAMTMLDKFRADRPGITRDDSKDIPDDIARRAALGDPEAMKQRDALLARKRARAGQLGDKADLTDTGRQKSLTAKQLTGEEPLPGEDKLTPSRYRSDDLNADYALAGEKGPEVDPNSPLAMRAANKAKRDARKGA